MALQTHLKRRGATYYARMLVPADLRETVGKDELAKSLRTADPRQAKRLLTPVIDSWQRDFEALRRRRDATEGDFADATWQHYVEELAIDAQDRAHVEDGTTRNFLAFSRVHQLKALRSHLGRGETVLIQWAADAYIAKQQLLVEPGTAQYRELCFRLMRAQIEALQRADERDQGDYTGKPADAIVERPKAPEVPIAKPGESVMELFEQYAAENPKRISAGTLTQARRDIGTFVELVGSDFPATAIDKKAVREWKAMLLKLPIKATESKAFKGMTLPETIKANVAVGKPVITHKTVNRYMAGFGAYCNWLAAQAYIEANPFTDMYLSVDKTKSSTETFTVEQMNKLFASPLFTGCRDGKKWSVPGDHKIRDHQFWIPLVMLYSGARVGEVAQLLVDDVQQQGEHWVIWINDEGDDNKRVKTRGSVRVVPIHSELVRLGFVDFVKRQREAGEVRVFPEAGRNSAGQIVATYTAKFGHYLEKLGMKEGRGLSLYSFRHGFVDAMRRAGYLDETFGFLVGHAKQTMTGRYGKIPQGMLAQRVELVEAVSYPKLDLSHLMPGV